MVYMQDNILCRRTFSPRQHGHPRRGTADASSADLCDDQVAIKNRISSSLITVTYLKDRDRM